MVENKKTAIVMIPTFNERENIGDLIEEILALPRDYNLSVLVVDDNSPDGTGGVVQKMAEEDTRVHLLLRTERKGRGAAGIDGFKAALDLAADYVIEMDGDFSHQPRFIPLLLENCRVLDVVIGSRFVPGGKDLDRGSVRKFVTFLARRFIKLQFRTPVKDVSSGFRCFKREVLEKIGLDDLISVGPSIVLEILYKVTLLNYKIGEVPILFIDRKQGRTKLNFRTLLKTLLMSIKFKSIYSRPSSRDIS
ncbi:MAG: polyprenol monophosphomannose synthase [Candidatus Aminicenantales bacterium]